MSLPARLTSPGPFRYSELSRIARDFTDAGFTLEQVEEIDVPVIEAETGVDIVAWARDLSLGQLAYELPSTSRTRFESDLAREVEPLRTPTRRTAGALRDLADGARADVGAGESVGPRAHATAYLAAAPHRTPQAQSVSDQRRPTNRSPSARTPEAGLI